MARPIEPTPVLEGEDADRLLEQLEDVCSPEEAERRIAAAQKLLARVVVADGVGAIVVRHADPSRWDLARLAAASTEDVELASAGLDGWTANLDHEGLG